MAQTTITVPDDKVARVLDAFDAEFPGRTEAGMTKVQWYKHQIIVFTKQVVKNFEGNQAAGAARSTVNSDVEAISIG